VATSFSISVCLKKRAKALSLRNTLFINFSIDFTFLQNSTGSSYTHTYGVDVLNNYLEGMKLPRFSTEERKLWNKYVKSAKSAYCKRFVEIRQYLNNLFV
jgi:hypothetical protein